MDRRAFLGGVGATTALGALSGLGRAGGASGESRRGATSVGDAARTDPDWAVDWRSRWPTFGSAEPSSEVQPVVGDGRLFLTPRVAGVPGRAAEYEGEDAEFFAVGLDTADGSHRDGNTIEMGILSRMPAGTVRAAGRFVTTGLADEAERTFATVVTLPDEPRGWTTRVDGVPAGPPAATDETVLVPAGASVAALSASDGSVAWTAPFDSPVTGVTGADGTVYAATEEGALSALDAATGDPRWTASPLTNLGLRGPTVAGDHLLALDGWGGVHAVGTDGSEAWSTIPNGVVTAPDDGRGATGPPGTVGPVAADGERCYVAAVFGPEDRERTAVTALSLADGSEAWTHEFASAPRDDVHSVRNGPTLQPRVVEGSVWAAGDRTAVALDAASGDLRRRWGFGHPLRATPLPTPSAVYFLDGFGVYRLDRSGSDCGPYEVSTAGVSYERGMDGEELSVDGGVTADGCPVVGTVDLVVDGEYLASAGGYVAAGEGTTPYLAYGWEDLPESLDRATLRFRGTDGTVVDTRRVAIDDYREEPPDFSIRCPSMATTNLGVGTSVTVTAEVSNSGSEPGYVATLEADGSVVARRSGEIAREFHDDLEPCDGTTLALSTLLTGFESREITVRVEPTADEGSGDAERFGTVQSGDPYALGGGVAGLTLLGTYVRRKRRGDGSD
ncbi:PQQ-binding-like beta-propeller repeat protein [Halosimplex halophilum]|uniref:PQQ-binding-like beta-propeller repeat protein n=1 Tax=Halosimplex halophilum TaxID=2559572 RepID=UPI00107F177A|nr:PQQ-binding-like beta-propeller repeat protein [Halosimplex halophilum]